MSDDTHIVTRASLRRIIRETGLTEQEVIRRVAVALGTPVRVEEFPGEPFVMVCGDHKLDVEVEGNCGDCGGAIFHTPGVPAHARLVCMRCYARRRQADEGAMPA